MKNWSDYTDEFGLYSEKYGYGWESGDSMERVGFKFIAEYFHFKFYGDYDRYSNSKITFDKQIQEVQIKPGMFCRHPRQSWTISKYSPSRDQHISNMVALGFRGNKKIILRFLLRHIARLGFFPNIMQEFEPDWDQSWRNWQLKAKFPDITSPEHIGMFIRALNLWPLYPFLILGDIFSVIGALITIYNCRKDPSTYDDLSGLCLMIQAKYVMPTPVSWLARTLYRKYRAAYIMTNDATPDSIIYQLDKDGLGAEYAMNRYFKWDWQPPFNELYNPMLKELLK